MKKLIWITAVLLMLSLTVVGCGSDSEEETTVPGTSEVGSTEQTQGSENTDAVPEATGADGEIDQETTQPDQSAQGTNKPQQEQSGNATENEVTGELTQEETKVTVPAIVLPDDIFTEEDPDTSVENPTESTVEPTTKPTVPEVTAPDGDIPVTETTTEPTTETPTEPVWNGGLGEGIELPLDIWE